MLSCVTGTQPAGSCTHTSASIRLDLLAIGGDGPRSGGGDDGDGGCCDGDGVSRRSAIIVSSSPGKVYVHLY